MMPTLRPGDVVWAEKSHTLARGHLVLVKKTTLLLKRIVGLPGEKIDWRKNRVSVNGKPLSEPYVLETSRLEPTLDGTWTLEYGTYFVLGDTRDDSLDSRKLGPVKLEDIKGIVVRRLWPFSAFGKLLGLILCLGAAGHAQPLPSPPRVLVFAADNQLAMPIGEYVPRHGWIESTNMYLEQPPGEVFTVFGLSGRLGEVTIQDKHQPLPGSLPIAWTARVERGATGRQPYALAILGSWPGADDISTEISLEDPLAVRIVSKYLKSHGLQVEEPILTQAIRVDLDGDGREELLLCAHSDDKALTEGKPGDIYAVALVSYGKNRKQRTVALASQISHKPASRSMDEHRHLYGTRDFYRFIAFYDINSDGRKEIVLYRSKADATQIDVYTYKAGRTDHVLSSYKPYYN